MNPVGAPSWKVPGQLGNNLGEQKVSLGAGMSFKVPPAQTIPWFHVQVKIQQTQISHELFPGVLQWPQMKMTFPWGGNGVRLGSLLGQILLISLHPNPCDLACVALS